MVKFFDTTAPSTGVKKRRPQVVHVPERAKACYLGWAISACMGQTMPGVCFGWSKTGPGLQALKDEVASGVPLTLELFLKHIHTLIATLDKDSANLSLMSYLENEGDLNTWNTADPFNHGNHNVLKNSLNLSKLTCSGKIIVAFANYKNGPFKGRALFREKREICRMVATLLKEDNLLLNKLWERICFVKNWTQPGEKGKKAKKKYLADFLWFELHKNFGRICCWQRWLRFRTCQSGAESCFYHVTMVST